MHEQDVESMPNGSLAQVQKFVPSERNSNSEPSIKALNDEGRAARQLVSRRKHADWNPHSQSHRDPLAILEEDNRNRLKFLLPIRHGRMLESPLAFFRGTPLVMARDLALTPISGFEVQACGDAHLLNFGLFATPERQLVFDINDFDETLSGPWEWDLKRLATSFVLAGRQYGLGEMDCLRAARASIGSYQKHIHHYSEMSVLTRWYSVLDEPTILAEFKSSSRRQIQRQLKEARERDNEDAVCSLTSNQDCRTMIVENPPVTAHCEDILSRSSLESILKKYKASLPSHINRLLDHYDWGDYALKVVGVGSVGTRCFAILLHARYEKETLCLQLKEATPSVLEGKVCPPWRFNQGQRTVEGQSLIQGFSDIFLGWSTDGIHDYYVRQLRDMKGMVCPDKCTAEVLQSYSELCGWALARAHTRSSEPARIGGYLGKSDLISDSIGSFALKYADQTERDFRRFQLAVRNGRFNAEHGI